MTSSYEGGGAAGDGALPGPGYGGADAITSISLKVLAGL